MTKQHIECIALIAVKCDIEKDRKLDFLEKRQEIYLRNYAKANRIVIADVVYSRGMGQMEINRQFNRIIDLIRRRKVDGVLVVNILSISLNLSDAYSKVGKVRAAGGMLITVEEGDLRLNIKRRNQNG